jgi:hypothetical protein
MARLTPDGESPSASAARAKLPPSTIAASTPTFATKRPSNAMSSPSRLVILYHQCHDIIALFARKPKRYS